MAIAICEHSWIGLFFTIGTRFTSSYLSGTNMPLRNPGLASFCNIYICFCCKCNLSFLISVASNVLICVPVPYCFHPLFGLKAFPWCIGPVDCPGGIKSVNLKHIDCPNGARAINIQIALDSFAKHSDLEPLRSTTIFFDCKTCNVNQRLFDCPGAVRRINLVVLPTIFAGIA